MLSFPNRAATMDKAISKLSLMPHTWHCSLYVPFREVEQQRGKPKINIWKTEGMLELSSWSEHTAAAMENLLPSLQNPCRSTRDGCIESPLPVASSSAGILRMIWLGSAHTARSQGFTQLELRSFAVVTLKAAQWQEVPPFIHQTRQSSAFAVCGGSILPWVLCKDFQINRCWLCQWDPLFYLRAESQLEQALSLC